MLFRSGQHLIEGLPHDIYWQNHANETGKPISTGGKTFSPNNNPAKPGYNPDTHEKWTSIIADARKAASAAPNVSAMNQPVINNRESRAVALAQAKAAPGGDGRIPADAGGMVERARLAALADLKNVTSAPTYIPRRRPWLDAENQGKKAIASAPVEDPVYGSNGIPDWKKIGMEMLPKYPGNYR